MARPRKHSKELLVRNISIRLSDADFLAWNEKVSSSGLSASEFFRKAIIENRTWVKAHIPVSSDKKQLIYLFNKTSNNMNQIAYRANLDNMKGVISEETYSSVLHALLCISRMLKKGIDDVD